VTSFASVASTNGNLHLDSKSGAFAIYLNHYNQGNTLLNTQGGRVGIGTQNPIAKLHVDGNTYLNGSLDVVSNTKTSGQAWFGFGNTSINDYTWTNAAITTNSIEIVNNNGPVSDSSPTLIFHRYGTGGPQFRLAADGSNVLYLESAGANSARNPSPYGGSGNWYFSRLHVDGGLTTVGNVGIGTTQPDAKLTVKGKIHAEEVKVDLSVPGPDYVFEKNYDLKPLEEVESYINANKHLPEIPSAKTMEKEGISMGEMQMKLLQKVEELTLYLIEQQKQNKLQQQQIENLQHELKQLQK
jgi:hypothetical protein